MPDLLENTENGITTLTLNRPERLNALSPAMTSGLKEALERLATDHDCGAIVIAGAGRGWCAGGDVKTMEAARPRPDLRGAGRGAAPGAPAAAVDPHGPEGRHRQHQRPGGRRRVLAGLACDLRIAGKSARFGTAFARIGYSGDYGGTWSLTRLVGTAKARELYFTADLIDAEEAGRLGIVNKVVADDELQAETTALARRIADGPRVALGYMKRNLFAAETEPFQTVLDLEAQHQARCGMTEDHKEAVAAFNEKRRPVFKGKARNDGKVRRSDGRALFRGVLRRPGVRARDDPHRHRDGQLLFTTMTMNPQPLHLDAEFAKSTEFGRPLVNSIFTLGLVIGISVGDTTLGTTVANLGMTDVRFPKPVFHGDTVRVRTTVMSLRRSKSRSDAGIVEFEHVGLNQHGETVAICRRAALMKTRAA